MQLSWLISHRFPHSVSTRITFSTSPQYLLFSPFINKFLIKITQGFYVLHVPQPILYIKLHLLSTPVGWPPSLFPHSQFPLYLPSLFGSQPRSHAQTFSQLPYIVVPYFSLYLSMLFHPHLKAIYLSPTFCVCLLCVYCPFGSPCSPLPPHYLYFGFPLFFSGNYFMPVKSPLSSPHSLSIPLPPLPLFPAPFISCHLKSIMLPAHFFFALRWCFSKNFPHCLSPSYSQPYYP